MSPTRRPALTALAALVPLLVAAPLVAQSVTIESLLSAPFPSGMTAAPAGGHIAWLSNDEGVRNIWVASPPDYSARMLTSYDADDGRELGGLTWSADGATLVFSRGGGRNRAGEFANPNSDPAGASQALWRIDVDGGKAVRIGGGSGAAPSPGNDVVAFTRDDQVWTAPLRGAEAEPEELFRVRGGAGSLRWSPDGDKLAFVSGRGDHSFVGVYHLAAKSITWMAPSVDEDVSPAWSPDGSRIAFLRIPASTELTLFKPVRTATP
ncbi:MAG: TolB family protein, partial [Longimicrobiales bacterium]